MKFLSSSLSFIGVALLVSIMSTSAAVLVLTPDPAKSTSSSYGGDIGGVLNDPFAYNPASPTNPLPDQVYSSNGDGYHADSPPATIAFTFDTYYQGLTLDLYGRNDFTDRDDDLIIQFYSGSWTVGDLTEEITFFDIDNSAPFYSRVTATAGTEADRFLITGNQQFFTIMELRANGTVVPEPSTCLLILSSAPLIGLMHRFRPNKG